jgi:methyltransferase
MGIDSSWLAIALGFIISRCAEWRIHKTNLDFMEFAGAEELAPRLARRYYQGLLLVIPFATAEGLLRVSHVNVALRLVCAGALLLALALRIWSIHSLGRLWTQKILCLPGVPKVKSGPYVIMNSPEYVSRVIDVIAIATFAGAYLTAVAFGLVYSYLGAKLAFVESRQLAELAGPEAAIETGSLLK